jgi:hypothetical protein
MSVIWWRWEWRKHGLKPYRVERYMASNNPDFEKKAADIIGLYLNFRRPSTRRVDTGAAIGGFS